MNSIIILITWIAITAGIYDYSFTDTDGNEVSISSFAGKKILIVNASLDSSNVNQYANLEQLQLAYPDSLVVIAFPSSSFINDTSTDVTIKNFIDSTYGRHYVLASKTDITGNNQNPIFGWLTTDSLNRFMDVRITSDFFKFLLNTNGDLIGVFNPEVPATDSSIIKAIERNFNGN